MVEVIEKVLDLNNLQAYVLSGDACQDLAREDPADPTIFRYRILLLSPGTWNDTDFSDKEIKAACKRANDAKAAAGVYKIPAMNGHSDDMTDMYGKVINAVYGKAQTKDGMKEGAIFDIECKSNLPPGDKIKDLIDWAPELVRFSARLRGQWLLPKNPGENVSMVNFDFIHVGTVPDPACTDAGILKELSRQVDLARYVQGSHQVPPHQGSTPSDLALSAAENNPVNMATQEDLARLEQENRELKTKLKEKDEQLAAKDAQLAAKDAELAKATKAPVIAAILALHKDADSKFLESLSTDQLTAYKADLEKRTPAQPPAPAGSTEKSLSAGGTAAPAGQTPLELSRKRSIALFGKPGGR